MDDRTLLELAARAAGYKVKGHMVNHDEELLCLLVKVADGVPKQRWNPLANSGDALELAASMHLDVVFRRDAVTVYHGVSAEIEEPVGDDPYAATRRAIARAAAAIAQQAQQESSHE